MDKNNVYSNAKVISKSDNIQNYQLGTFAGNELKEENGPPVIISENIPSNHLDPIISQITNLSTQLNTLTQKIDHIENNGAVTRDIDKQVVQAIKDLKHYANFFEQASFQMETKLLKTSISIAKKIISIEVGENSTLIAKETIKHLLEKIKSATRVKIHLNPKDYEILKDDLSFDKFIELVEDANVTAGGVVIASDLGNFDGNIESKVSSMLETLDSLA
ncbi:MAG: FliH/SctL family protein [Halarcobacter sp.]